LKRNQKQQRERQPVSRSFHIQPKNKNQQMLLDAIDGFPITVALGCAGVGKTYIAASKVAQLFLAGGYDHIILARANVGVGSTLGFLPGTADEKLEPWLFPIISVLEKQLTKFKYDYYLNKKVIQLVPLEVIRGRSFENSLVIVDEAQNLSIEELKAVTTRMGENSKMVLCGDATQSDVGRGSGILSFASMCERNGIDLPVVEFGLGDIVRSDIVGKLVRMFYQENI
jgi:phosphate starvation-inducible PhoH-like protein